MPKVLSIFDFITNGMPEDVYSSLLIGNFKCSEKNKDVEGFLLNKSFKSCKEDHSRTYIVLDDSEDILANRLIGYFTVAIKLVSFDESMSNSIKRKLGGNKDAEAFSGVLIAQIGKNFNYKGNVEKGMLIKEAENICHQLYVTAGIKVIVLEHDSNNSKLNKYYESHGYKTLYDGSSDQLKMRYKKVNAEMLKV